MYHLVYYLSWTPCVDIFDVQYHRKSYSHFSRGPENGRIAPGVGQNARPWALCINQPHLIISLLISHYQSDGIIDTLQYSETLMHIIVNIFLIILLRTVTEIVN